MAVPTTGPLSLVDLQAEFGGANPISLSEYYRGGPYINSDVVGANIPTSGPISLSAFRGAYKDVKGQAEYTTPGVYTWVAPPGVTSVSVVCVGGGGGTVNAGGNSSFSGAGGTLTANGGGKNYGGAGTALGSSLSTGTVGGGNGGSGGTAPEQNRNGGGAGGYSGNGGTGSSTYYCGAGGGGVGIYGGTGAGGGGGYPGGFQTQFRGAGASGGEGGGITGQGGAYGGAAGTCDGGVNNGSGGGGLRYVTSYAVTPGQAYVVTVGAPGQSAGRGAVRIIWGAGRAYPNTNTANV